VDPDRRLGEVREITLHVVHECDATANERQRVPRR